MRVLLTGASGFLGRPLAAALVRAGAHVRAITRRQTPLPANVERFQGDLASSDKLAAAFDGVDVLVHLAASMRGAMADLERDNVEGTRRLLEAMARSATRRVVLASSLSVYDWTRVGGTLTEDDATLDESAMAGSDGYARTKALQEQLMRAWARQHGWTLTVLRPAAIRGPGVWAEFILGTRWRQIQIVVAPRAPVRLVCLHNAVDAFVKAARREHGGELVLNLVHDAGLSNWQYARIVRKHRGGVLVPVPYALGLLAAKGASRAFRAPERLPYFLRPAVYQMLHKPAGCSSAAACATLNWKPSFTWS